MAEITNLGNDIPVFGGLCENELKLLSDASVRLEKKTGEVIFKEGDPGSSMLVILDGKVKITKKITEGVECTLLTLQRGGVFGELSVISGELRTASAVAVTAVVMLALERAMFKKMAEDNPELGRKLTLNLLQVVSSRLNTTTEMYRQAASWGMQISGAVELNYNRLIADNIGLSVELLTGKKISGVLLKADRAEHGLELMIRSDEERIVIVPFHAVAEISFPARQFEQKQNN
jgi:CRP-like cAMP-binding protein